MGHPLWSHPTATGSPTHSALRPGSYCGKDSVTGTEGSEDARGVAGGAAVTSAIASSAGQGQSEAPHFSCSLTVKIFLSVKNQVARENHFALVPLLKYPEVNHSSRSTVLLAFTSENTGTPQTRLGVAWAALQHWGALRRSTADCPALGLQVFQD